MNKRNKTFLTLIILLFSACKSYQEDMRILDVTLVNKLKTFKVERLVPIKLNTKIEKLMVFKNELGTFDFDKSKIKYSTITIDSLKTVLKNKVKGQKGELWVVGHTDSIGSKEYNKYLSLKRAHEVSNLIKKLLPEESKVKIKEIGRGEKEPIFRNDSILNRRKNRRVEVFFIRN